MKCKGCGVEIQTENPESPGYIMQRVLDERLADGREVVCQRCFKLKHYGNYDSSELGVHSVNSIKKYLDMADKVLYIIDVTDFEGTYRPEISSLLKGKDVYYILNKVDLIPSEVTSDEIKGWASNQLHVSKKRLQLVSAKRNRGVAGLIKFLKGKENPVYLVLGVTNVGKSSLLNSITNTNSLTSSKYPGTTLKVVQLRDVENGIEFIDTPGIYTTDRFTDLLREKDQGKLLPSKKLIINTFNFREERTVFIGGLVKLTFEGESKKDTVFHVFSPENVTVHETNVEKSDEKWREWFGDLLKPPFGKDDFDDYKWKSQRITLYTGEELLITGLGWINVAKGPITIDLTLPKQVKYIIRNGLIGPEKFKK